MSPSEQAGPHGTPDGWRAGGVLVALLVVLSAASIGTAGAASQETVIVVTPSVSPTQPTTAENFTVTATVHAERGGDGYTVETVALREGRSASSELLAENVSSETFFSGETVRRDLSVDVDDPGEHQLYLHTTFERPDGEQFDVVRPVDVLVRSPHPSLSLTAAPTGTDDETTLSLTVTNGLDHEVRALELNVAATGATLQSTRKIASALSPGGAETFQVTATNVTGTVETTVDLSYRDPDGERRQVTRTLSAVPSETSGPVPTMSLSAAPVGASGETTLNVSVVNTREGAIRSMVLELSGDVPLAQSRKVRSRVKSGERVTFTFETGSVSPGEKTLQATLRYTTADGIRRQVTRSLSTVVSEPSGSTPTMSATAKSVGPGGETTLSVDVVNTRERAIRSMALSLASSELSLAQSRKVHSRVKSGERVTFTFETGSVSPGEKTLQATLTYTTVSGARLQVERELQVSVDRLDNPGNVTLTGVRVTRGRGGLTVRGSASNIGTTNVSGVVVRVRKGDGVRPAQSQSSFFVGNVPAGDFTSFEVNVQATRNGTVTIPVEVSYVVDGTRVERVYHVTHQVAPRRSPQPRQSSGGDPPLTLLVGGVAIVGGVVAWRRLR